MTQEDGLRILQYNITNLQSYITFHVILLSLLNEVGVSTKYPPILVYGRV